MNKVAESRGSIEQYIGLGKVFIFSKSYCPFCDKAKNLLSQLEIRYDFKECDEAALTRDEAAELHELSGVRTFPNIFIGKKSLGGCDNLLAAYSTGKLFEYLQKEGIEFKSSK